MILKRLQDLIGSIYDVSITHDVYDFLVTDRRQLPAIARSESPTDEELIVSQPADGVEGGELAMSLYLDPRLLERLGRADPIESLHHGNVADYWTALEGVSHFLYLAWNAGHDKPVSLLELEMQAEVDKYVASYWLMRQQFPDRFPAELLRLLFDRTRIDPRLAAGRESMYREASRYAEKFCRRLERSLQRQRGQSAKTTLFAGGNEAAVRKSAGAPQPAGGFSPLTRDVLAELRRFYRLTNARKVAHIEQTA